MPAASDKRLLRALHEVKAFQMKHPGAFEDLVGLVERNRIVGYKNLSKMVLGEFTEDDLGDGE